MVVWGWLILIFSSSTVFRMIEKNGEKLQTSSENRLAYFSRVYQQKIQVIQSNRFYLFYNIEYLHIIRSTRSRSITIILSRAAGNSALVSSAKKTNTATSFISVHVRHQTYDFCPFFSYNFIVHVCAGRERIRLAPGMQWRTCKTFGVGHIIIARFFYGYNNIVCDIIVNRYRILKKKK